MKKILLLITIYLICSSLFAQNIDKKKDELKKLKSAISKQDELIKKTEVESKKAKKTINKNLKKKKEYEQKLEHLKKNEDKTQDKLNITKKNLQSNREKLSKYDKLRQDELIKLCHLFYERLIFPIKETDSNLIAKLVDGTSNEIYEISGIKNELEKSQKKVSKELENINWSKYVVTKNKKKVKNKINKLNKDISKYKKQKKKALAKKKKLEEEASALNELIAKLRISENNTDYSYKFSTTKLNWPLNGKVLAKFGLQKSDKYNVTLENNGIDISALPGTEVKAVEDGVVAFAEWFKGQGKVVIIDHKNGFFTLYSQNSRLLVSKGDNVKKGQNICLSGDTGSKTQPFLHFEIRKRGNPVDPLKYLK